MILDLKYPKALVNLSGGNISYLLSFYLPLLASAKPLLCGQLEASPLRLRVSMSEGRIRLVLRVARTLQQWDGLGLTDPSAYDSYVEDMVKLIEAGAGIEGIALFLTAIAPLPERNKYFASRLKALQAPSEPHPSVHDGSNESLKD